MKKELSFLLSPTLGIIKVFSNNLSRLLPIFTVLQRGDERQKYGVIELAIKKPSDPIRPAMCRVCIHVLILIPKKSLKKNNTNSEFTSVFVLFPCGGMNRAMSNCTPSTKRQNIYWFRLFSYKMTFCFHYEKV